MSDVEGKIVVGAGKALFKQAAKDQAKKDLKRVNPDLDPKVEKAATTLVSTTIDFMADTVGKGDIQPATIITAVVKNSGTFVGLSDNEKAQCVSALLALAGESISLGTQASFIAGEEFATAGVATPFALAQAALVAKSAVDIANAAIKANQQCGPLVVQSYSETVNMCKETSFADIMMRFEIAIRQLYGVPY